MAKRIEKVNELLKEVVSSIILRSIQFPDGTLVTVTRVLTSPDIHYANIFVTVFSQKMDTTAEAMKILAENTAAVQRALNKKLRMRPVPRIQFLIDKEETRREKVERLLSESRRAGDIP